MGMLPYLRAFNSLPSRGNSELVAAGFLDHYAVIDAKGNGPMLFASLNLHARKAFKASLRAREAFSQTGFARLLQAVSQSEAAVAQCLPNSTEPAPRLGSREQRPQSCFGAGEAPPQIGAPNQAPRMQATFLVLATV